MVAGANRSLPDLKHGLDVAVAQVTRIGHSGEPSLYLEVAEETAQEVGPFLPRFVRDRLFQRGVQ
jgi:hypothetical protein